MQTFTIDSLKKDIIEQIRLAENDRETAGRLVQESHGQNELAIAVDMLKRVPFLVYEQTRKGLYDATVTQIPFHDLYSENGVYTRSKRGTVAFYLIRICNEVGLHTQLVQRKFHCDLQIRWEKQSPF